MLIIKTMERLEKLKHEVAAWSDETFYQEDSNIQSIKRSIDISYHMQKESKELTEAIEDYFNNPNPENLKKVKVKYADNLLLLLDGIDHFGLTLNKLTDEGFEKLEINKKCDWGTPDKNGVVEHVKEKMYYVVSIEHTDMEQICFWRQNDAGYTELLEDAGKYTEKQIKENQDYYNNNESTFAVECSKVEDLISIRVLVSNMKQLRNQRFGIK